MLFQQDAHIRMMCLLLSGTGRCAAHIRAGRFSKIVIFCGVLATGNSSRVAMLTLLSVACAERITATSNSNGVLCSSSVVGGDWPLAAAGISRGVSQRSSLRGFRAGKCSGDGLLRAFCAARRLSQLRPAISNPSPMKAPAAGWR